MIKIFQATDTNFSTNGDVILRPLKCICKNSDNGEYYLDIETSLDYAEYLVHDNIVVAPTPRGEQPFRIKNPEKTRTKIKFKADHVFFDSKNELCNTTAISNQTCAYALNVVNPIGSKFTTSSDITSRNSLVMPTKSLYEAFMEICALWGGHLDRDGFNVGVKTATGADNQVTIRYGKNLKDLTYSEDWSDVVTKLLPIGKDGIRLDDLDPTEDVYVYSDTQYDIPYTKTMTFDQDIEETGDEDYDRHVLVEDLRSQAQAYVNANCIPHINYTLSADIEKITDIGDTIKVEDERLGIDVLTDVISFEYDCLTGRFVQVEFGNFRKSINGLAGGITNIINQSVRDASLTLQSSFISTIDDSITQVLAMFKRSFVLYDGNEILVLDRLPKEDARYIMRIDRHGVGFSTQGINAGFTTAWSVDGTLDLSAKKVIGLTANLIKGGVLKTGQKGNDTAIEVFNQVNRQLAKLDANGIRAVSANGTDVRLGQYGLSSADCWGRDFFKADANLVTTRNQDITTKLGLLGKFQVLNVKTSSVNGVGFFKERE